MSFAMDDLSGYGTSPASSSVVQPRLTDDTRTVEKTADVSTSDSTSKEPEVNDVFEVSQQKPSTKQSSLESLQVQSTSIDIVNNALDNINSKIEDLKKILKSDNKEDISKKIEENYKKIEQIAKETSFNGNDLMPDSTLQELKIPDIKEIKADTQKQKELADKKLDEIMQNIAAQKAQLAQKQETINTSINKNSIVEIKINPEEEEQEVKEEQQIKQEEASPEKLKENAINSIKEHPAKSRKVQIKHLDKNLLLAMLSLRAA